MPVALLVHIFILLKRRHQKHFHFRLGREGLLVLFLFLKEELSLIFLINTFTFLVLHGLLKIMQAMKLQRAAWQVPAQFKY